MVKCNNVYDISKISSLKDEVMYLDTNIWYWLTYPRVNFKNEKEKNKATEYIAFVSSLLANDVELCSTLFTYSELINIVERNEFNLVKKEFESNKKKFRKDPTKRTETVEIISTVLAQVEAFSVPGKIVQILDYIEVDTLIEGLQKTRLDGNDLIVALLGKDNGIVNIVSDDGDFSSLEGINLYTLNREVIEEAERQGKLKEAIYK